MKWLLATDPHLTARPEHAYRIQWLDWLYDQCIKHQITALILMGDLSDAKDGHPGDLLNAIGDRIKRLAQIVELHIIYGNHDGPSPDRAYWRILALTDLNYYTHACPGFVNGVPVIFSPWGTEDAGIKLLHELPQSHSMFMHATVQGAVVENGTVMEGGCPSRFKPSGCLTHIWSGDIHVPQDCGDVRYIGSPYHIHYGDKYAGAVVVYDYEANTETRVAYEEAPRLMAPHIAFGVPDVLGRYRVGDRMKVTVETDQVILPKDWIEYRNTLRQTLTAKGIIVTSISLDRRVAQVTTEAPSNRRSDESVVRTYGERQGYGQDIVEAGVAIVKADT